MSSLRIAVDRLLDIYNLTFGPLSTTVNDTFKYGDACESGDDKYVVAQFRSDASLAWVPDLRSFLNLAELKYRDFHPRRNQVMSNAEMWAKFEKGVQQAEITIVDPLYYKQAVLSDWLDQKAEPGIDFDLKMVNDSAGESMLQMSPLGIAESTSIDFYYQHVASMRPRAVSRRMSSFKTSRLRLSSAARAED